MFVTIFMITSKLRNQSIRMTNTYSMEIKSVEPFVSIFGVFCPDVPDIIIRVYIKAALIYRVALKPREN